MNKFIMPIVHRVVGKVRRVRRHAKLVEETEMPELTVEDLHSSGLCYKSWPAEVLESMIRVLYKRVFEAGECICHQSDPSHVVYILVSGEVDVVVRKANRFVRVRRLHVRWPVSPGPALPRPFLLPVCLLVPAPLSFSQRSTHHSLAALAREWSARWQKRLFC